MHNTMKAIYATELYTQKWLRWQSLLNVFHHQNKKASNGTISSICPKSPLKVKLLVLISDVSLAEHISHKDMSLVVSFCLQDFYAKKTCSREAIDSSFNKI